MTRLSLRARFALLTAALVLAVAAAVAAGGYLAMRSALLGRADREARTQAQQLAAMVDTSAGAATTAGGNLVDIHDAALTAQLRAPGYLVVVLGPGSHVIRASVSGRSRPVPRLPSELVRGCLTAGTALARLSHPEVALACQRVGSRAQSLGTVTVGVPLGPSLDALGILRTALLLAVGVGVLAAGALAWALAGRAARPIARIARTAEAIRSGRRPFGRIGYRGHDELGELAAVLDACFAELEDALERQRRFGADASHELRTPLAAIRANIELLRGWAATEPDARTSALHALDQASRRASRLVEDLLYLATLEQEPRRAQAPVALDELLVDVAREASGLTDRVAIHVARLDEVTIRGDALALQQVLLNLIDNAQRVTPAGGTITLSLAADDTQAAITVSDQGPGIDPARIAHIFDRFYTHRAPGAELAGAGLGLAIARRIAEDHGGALTAENTAGSGATFTLVLPAAGDAVALADDPAAASALDNPVAGRRGH